MTHIIAIRHGEAPGNIDSRFHGIIPTDLTEKGHLQAECSAQLLKNAKIDAIYASDLPRAVSTATHIAKYHHLPVQTDVGLREINGGDWENMTFQEIAVKFPQDLAAWQNDLCHARPTHGESMPEVKARVSAAFARIAKENEEKTVVVVSHASALRSVCTLWAGVPDENIYDFPYVPNVSLTYVDYESDGSCKLIKFGEAEHLKKAGLFTELNIPRNI